MSKHLCKLFSENLCDIFCNTHFSKNDLIEQRILNHNLIRGERFHYSLMRVHIFMLNQTSVVELTL